MILLGCLWSPITRATPTDLMGSGTTMGRLGGGVAVAGDANSAFSNPASVRGPSFSTGISATRGWFDEIPGLRWDTDGSGGVTDDDAPLLLEAGPDPHERVDVGVAHAFSRFVVAGVIGVPMRRLIRVEALDASLPRYPLYDNRLERVSAAFVGNARVGDGFYLGGGAELIPWGEVTLDLTVGAGVDDLLGTGLPGVGDEMTVDVHSLDLDLHSRLVPTLGWLWSPPAGVAGIEGLRAGASFRGASALPVDIDVDLRGKITLLDVEDEVAIGVTAPIAFSLADHYIPAAVRLGLAWQQETTWFVDGRWHRWSGMTANIAQLTDGALESAFLDLSDVEVVDNNEATVVFRDVVEGTLGFDGWRVGPVALSAAATFAPSPVVEAGGILLDGSRLGLGLGVTHAFEPAAIDLSFSAQVQQVLPGTVTSNAELGAPLEGSSIPVGGTLAVIGVTMRTIPGGTVVATTP